MNRRIARKVLKQHYLMHRARWRHINAAHKRLPRMFGGPIVVRKNIKPTIRICPYIKRVFELSSKEYIARAESLAFSFLWEPT